MNGLTAQKDYSLPFSGELQCRSKLSWSTEDKKLFIYTGLGQVLAHLSSAHSLGDVLQ